MAFAPADLVCGRPHLPVVAGFPEAIVSSVCERPRTATVPPDIGHNKLLGGHGNDLINAGPAGDVLWGDYKPSGQPSTQVDRLYGGPGKDYIYASHGPTRSAPVAAATPCTPHFGRGSITCNGSSPTIFLSRRSRKRYRLHGCQRISYFTRGY